MTALYSIAIIILSMLVLCLWCCLVAASDADDRADEIFREIRRVK